MRPSAEPGEAGLMLAPFKAPMSQNESADGWANRGLQKEGVRLDSMR